MADSPFDPEDLAEIIKDSILGMTQADIDEYALPFPVGIAHDYREPEEQGPEGILEGYIGVCLGLYVCTDKFDRLEELEKITDINQILQRSLDPPFVNPLVYVPKAGAYIWGIESDWILLDEHDDRLRKMAEAWEAQVTRGKDMFLEAALAQVQELLYHK